MEENNTEVIEAENEDRRPSGLHAADKVWFRKADKEPKKCEAASDDVDEDFVVLSAPDAADLSPGGRLCGYLNKIAGRGPLRAAKTRWFCLEPRSCRLYYYRTARDARPLGHIDVASATFSYELDAAPGHFVIRTPSRDFTLQATNREIMMYWLQELQHFRREYSLTQSAGLTPHGVTASTMDAEGTGRQEESIEQLPAPEHEASSLLTLLPEPLGLVGEHAACLPAPMTRTAISNYSLKHLGTEIRNSVCQLRAKRTSRENKDDRQSLFSFNEDPEGRMADSVPVENDSAGTMHFIFYSGYFLQVSGGA
uniref:TBC1 domain family member 2A-like n=1 Tax=Myxine glutinosa TaxID=7769 RepID=UPI00358F88A7